MSIYITGDQHGAWDGRKDFIQSLTETDILITLGDWGWNWTELHFQEYLKENPKCLQLWLDGNHCNFSILNTYPVVDLFGGKVHKLADNIYHLIRGEMYEIEGNKFFAFGGALSIDKRWRAPYISWWPQEIPTKEEYNHALETLEKNDWKFDVLLTHTAETELVRKVLGRNDTIYDNTEKMIQELKYQIREHNGSFKYHFFGHLHEFWKSIDGDYEWYCLYRQIMDFYSNSIYFY